MQARSELAADLRECLNSRLRRTVLSAADALAGFVVADLRGEVAVVKTRLVLAGLADEKLAHRLRVIHPLKEARSWREGNDGVGPDAVVSERAIAGAAAVAEELVAQLEHLLDDAILTKVVVCLDELLEDLAVARDDGDLLRCVVSADEAVRGVKVGDRRKVPCRERVEGGRRNGDVERGDDGVREIVAFACDHQLLAGDARDSVRHVDHLAGILVSLAAGLAREFVVSVPQVVGLGEDFEEIVHFFGKLLPARASEVILASPFVRCWNVVLVQDLVDDLLFFLVDRVESRGRRIVEFVRSVDREKRPNGLMGVLFEDAVNGVAKVKIGGMQTGGELREQEDEFVRRNTFESFFTHGRDNWI